MWKSDFSAHKVIGTQPHIHLCILYGYRAEELRESASPTKANNI